MKKNPGIFRFVTYYSWILRTKQGFSPIISIELCYTTWKFNSQEPRPMEIPDDAFLITPGNSPFLNSNYSLEFRHSNFSILLKILRPQPSVRIFTGIGGLSGSSGLFQKKSKRGVKTWNIQGFQRNTIWKVQASIKKGLEFSRVTKKINIEFPEITVFGIENSRGCNTILRANFPKVKLCYVCNF